MADLRRVAALVALAALAAAGCGGVPESGPVHAGRLVLPGAAGDDGFIRPIVTGPASGASPARIVAGFLAASGNLDENNLAARAFLTDAAAAIWQPGTRAAIYDDRTHFDIGPTRSAGLTSTVTMAADRVATIGSDGGYTRAGSHRLSATFRLVRQQGQWRIENPPHELLLTALDLERSYQVSDVYFLNRSLDQVVPDRVFLTATGAGRATALVRAVLRGPSGSIAPAVRTAVPPGTSLLGSAPVDAASGVVTVDLSRQILDARPAQRRELSAQLVWTLRQLPEVSGLRILADGSPLDVPGVPDVQTRSSWPGFAPDALPADATAFYRTHGRWQTVSGVRLPGPLGTGHLDLDDVAIGPGVDIGAGIGAHRNRNGLVTLYTGSVSLGPTPVLSASAITPPSVDGHGEVWAAEPGSPTRVVMVPPGGRVQPVAAPGLANLDVSRLRISRDGARVAVVAAAGDRVPRLLVGRVSVLSHGGLRIDGLRQVAPGLRVREVSWSAADKLAVLASVHGVVQLWTVAVDGSEIAPIATSGLPSYLDVAAAPQLPIVVSFARNIYLADSGGWSFVGHGGQPAYPG
jgi:hypothetical protein